MLANCVYVCYMNSCIEEIKFYSLNFIESADVPMKDLQWESDKKVQWKASDEQISINNLLLWMAAPVTSCFLVVIIIYMEYQLAKDLKVDGSNLTRVNFFEFLFLIRKIYNGHIWILNIKKINFQLKFFHWTLPPRFPSKVFHWTIKVHRRIEFLDDKRYT